MALIKYFSFVLLQFSLVNCRNDHVFKFDTQWMLNPLLVREVNGSIALDDGFDLLAKQLNRRYAPGRGLLRLQIGSEISHYKIFGMDDITGNLIRYLLDGKQKYPGHHDYTSMVYATMFLERKLNSIGNPYMHNNIFETDYSYNFEEEWMFLTVQMREISVTTSSDAGFDDLAVKLNSTGHTDCYGRGLLRLQVGADIVHHRFFNLTDVDGKLIRYLLYSKFQPAGEHQYTQPIYATAYMEQTVDSMNRYNNKPDNMLAKTTEIIRETNKYSYLPYAAHPNCVDCDKIAYRGEGNII